MIVEVLSLWSLAIVPARHLFYRIDDYISVALRCFLYLNFEYFFFLSAFRSYVLTSRMQLHPFHYRFHCNFLCIHWASLVRSFTWNASNLDRLTSWVSQICHSKNVKYPLRQTTITIQTTFAISRRSNSLLLFSSSVFCELFDGERGHICAIRRS